MQVVKTKRLTVKCIEVIGDSSNVAYVIAGIPQVDNGAHGLAAKPIILVKGAGQAEAIAMIEAVNGAKGQAGYVLGHNLKAATGHDAAYPPHVVAHI